MGRTLPSATQVFHQTEQMLGDFRRGLGPLDQRVIKELFNAAHKHLAAVAYAAHPLPTEMFLLAILVEQHKELQRLKTHMEQVMGKPIDPHPRNPRKLF